MLLRKSKYKMKDFLQTLSNGKKVFDFTKISQAGFPVNVLLTERGSKGKTLNVKEYLRKRYEELDRPSIFMNNTKILAEKTIQDFTKDLNKISVKKELSSTANLFWENSGIKGNLDKGTAWLKNGDKEVIKILGLSQAENMKGSRIAWTDIVWDEFNVGYKSVRQPMVKIDSLLHSAEDLVANHGKKPDLKMWVFGNSKSLNNEFIYKLGITHIPHEISEIYDENDNPLVLIVSPQFSEKEREEIKETNKTNWIYNFSTQIGTASHSYFNESINDEMNKVIVYDNIQEPINSVVKINNKYIASYAFGVDIHFKEIDRELAEKYLVFAINRKDVSENVKYQPKLKTVLLKFLEKDNLTFQTLVTRDDVVGSIAK